jgi:hypothetical protein
LDHCDSQCLDDMLSAPSSAHEPYQSSVPYEFNKHSLTPPTNMGATGSSSCFQQAQHLYPDIVCDVVSPSAATTSKRQRGCRDGDDRNGATKYRRSHISTTARSHLEAEFLLDPYPNEGTVFALTTETGLSVRTIRNWFSNSRSRGLPSSGKSLVYLVVVATPGSLPGLWFLFKCMGRSCFC